MKTRIMIIDDDSKLNRMLNKYLSQYAYIVDSYTNPLEAIEALTNDEPSIIILDVMMPHINGFETCKRIRKISDVPIIMLTARGDVSDRIAGLESGVDDYMAKPFEPRELVARISAILKRTERQIPIKKEKGMLEYGSLKIDLSAGRAYLNGDPMVLTQGEMSVLSLFARHPFNVMDRDAIQNELNGSDWDAYNRSVDVTVSRIRAKLGDDPKNPGYIKTVWGTGYMFIAEPLS
jgi:two-component system phosphate regulon response regulator OmpR